ncbi:MAG: TlpA family protein disulfide reductase, partial [Planctomycetes bacterium]|nr:TlpA family protein disulfide reductase [Planctomycetota bacterium]
TDDEGRALVRWHRADALRDREDLPENAGFDELEKLADDLPDTYWGGVARDRLRATRLGRGDPAIDFKARTLDGAEVSLSGLRGKVVVLPFWSSGDFDLETMIRTLADLTKTHGAKLAVLGICLDRDAAAIRENVTRLGITFPVIGTGKGIETDAALRWFVEGPTLHVIDREGKVRALGLHAGTADARRELAEIIAAALR